MILDHKGKTGSIDVIFNGIDSNTLRLSSYFNKDTLHKKNSINNNTNIVSNDNNNSNNSTLSTNVETLQNLNTTTTSNTLPTNPGHFSSTTQPRPMNFISNNQVEGAVGGEAASAVAPAAGFIPMSSNETSSNANIQASASNLNSIQELSIGLPQG